MQTFIVMPCLNEETNIAAACASLGFGQALEAPSNTSLIIVDNGSTDCSLAIIEGIAASAEPGSIALVREAERGYVPPRRHGVAEAARLAVQAGVSPDAALIVQVDADTVYRPGYVAHLQSAAIANAGSLLHGRTASPSTFLTGYPDFERLCREVDQVVSGLCVSEANFVIVDDKVSAFRLSDYLAWGGLTREYDQYGDEVHAETSRMFLRAKTMGARLHYVDDAIAEPSRRKVVMNPPLYFSTGGFPHTRLWLENWHHKFGAGSFEQLAQGAAQLDAFVALRQAHEVILFGALPCLISEALQMPLIPENRLLAPLIALFSACSGNDVRHAPGGVIASATGVIEKNLGRITAFITGRLTT